MLAAAKMVDGLGDLCAGDDQVAPGDAWGGRSHGLELGEHHVLDVAAVVIVPIARPVPKAKRPVDDHVAGGVALDAGGDLDDEASKVVVALILEGRGVSDDPSGHQRN